MFNLLAAGFIRIFKSLYFWGVFIIVSLLNIYMGLVNRRQITELFQEQTPGAILFNHTLFIGIAAAILVGLFIGDEYSDKTLRNKLIGGYNRVTVFFSYYIVVFTATVICHIAAMLTGYVFGRIFIGTLTISFSLLFKHTFYSLFPIAAMCGISLCIMVLVQNKAIGCGIGNCLATCLAFGGNGIIGMLITHEIKDSLWVNFWPEAYLYQIRSYEDLVVNECLTEISFPVGCICVCLVFLVTGAVIFRYRDIR